MHVIGTAGHVDHGKSSLVRALTGTDPDRWIEEQLRGMTLDLGFAHLRFPDGAEAGIVDVPGHERFVHNMLAGASGMEVLLLVVAANDGVRPQTREHLAILDYLGVRRTLVVLTKCDLADDHQRELVRAEVSEAVAGTVAQGAPVLEISTLTGAGLDALRDALHETLAALPARAPDAPVFLPVDRVFAMAGHGTVVTGTLMQGRIAVGDTLRLDVPGRDVRVRALQVFGARRESVDGGSRVAVNLAGVDVAETRRGAVLADPLFAAGSAFAVRFRPAPGARATLRRRTPVRAYLGAGEILGTLVFASAAPADDASVDAELFLRRPVVTYPAQPFVLRALSPKALLGGGTLGAAATQQDAGSEAHAPEVEALLRVLAEGGLTPRTAAELGARANVREERAAEVLDEFCADGRARRLHKPLGFVDGGAADALGARIADALTRREAESPWMLGATSLALSRELSFDEPLLVRVLAAEAEDGRIVARAGYYATLAHRPALSAEQRAFFESAVSVPDGQPFTPVPLETLVDTMRRARITGLAQAFDTLLATGALVKVGGDVYRGAQLGEIRARLVDAIRREGPITMARFRDAVGTTRKYAVPLMEWFDATGVTVRNGDLRALRATVKS